MNKYDGYVKFKEVFDHDYETATEQVNRLLKDNKRWHVLDIKLGTPTIYLLGQK